MILVGYRRTEQRHDAVAHHLVHRALVVMHGLHHSLEHGVEQLARILGITVGQQLHGALEVGEEDGDLLALTFEGALGGENLVGQVLGSVGLRFTEAGLRTGARNNGLTAFQAELCAGRQFALTLGTDERQAGSALQAELGVRRVIVLATRTLHESGPTRPRRPTVRRDQTLTGSSPNRQPAYDLSRGRASLHRAMLAHLKEAFDSPEMLSRLLGSFSPRGSDGKITRETQVRNNTAT